jgi:transposase, IS5 family
MKPRERHGTGEQDLFRARLDQIINMEHELVKLAKAISWRFIEEKCGAVYSDGPGMPPLPTRLMAGLAILKHTFDLSDEELCARWVENPYFQYLCGEEFFCHELPFDRSSMTRWRQRMGEERIVSLLQESLHVAVETGAMKPSDTGRVIVDTTVQPKNVMFPTDAKLINRAREILVQLARKAGIDLRQSYRRVGKLALIRHQRYAHAHQFKRAVAQAQDLSRTHHPRPRPPDRRRGRPSGRLSAPIAPSLPGARAEPSSERAQGLQPPRSRGRMHRQRQGPCAL